MEKVLNKFYDFIDKIGKPNFIFLAFIIFIILVTGLYQTFSLFTSTDGTSIIDGILTYKFILNNDNTENSITIAADNTKNIMLTISNPETLNLKYGIYYSSSDDLTNVSLGYLSSSEHKATETIASKNDYIIKLKVNNASSSDVTIKFGISYGLETGGDLQLDTGKHWLGEYYPYKETLEYLESDGVHYINTGVAPSNMNIKVELEYQYLANNLTWDDSIMGSRSEGLDTRFYPSSLGGTNDRHVLGDNEVVSTSDLNKHTVLFNDEAHDTYLDGTKIGNLGTSFTPHNQPMYLFGLNFQGSFQYQSHSRIYHCKIWDNGILIRDYIPVKDIKGVSCLYDKVTEELYYLKQGTRYLSEALVGSYVKYTGNNGCSGKSCEGQNANYVSGSTNGYCWNADYTFANSGWRIAYIQNNTAYLTSAGATDCMSTDASGNTSAGTASSSTSGNGRNTHFTNMNNIALKYCNSKFAYDGVCNSSSAWAMSANDHKIITGGTEITNCIQVSESTACGYNNSLLDNGGFYWFATANTASNTGIFEFGAQYRRVGYYDSNLPLGVRPVIRLDNSVIVTGGIGTASNPYTIDTNIEHSETVIEGEETSPTIPMG